MVKGCYGSSCEIGVGMVVCSGMFVRLLIRFGRGWGGFLCICCSWW